MMAHRWYLMRVACELARLEIVSPQLVEKHQMRSEQERDVWMVEDEEVD